MHPIPCAWCGTNFMRKTLDESHKLCNNCEIKENLTKPKNKGSKMEKSTVSIMINCPREDQIKIEEYCINEGIDFSRYFMQLHYSHLAALEEMNRLLEHPRPILMGEMEEVKEEPEEEQKEQKKFKKLGKK